MEQTNAAIDLMPRVRVTNSEASLLLGYVMSDRKNPSKDRTRRTTEVIDAFCRAYGASDLDALIDHFRVKVAPEWNRADIEIAMSRGVANAIRDFVEEALSEKDKDGNSPLSAGDRHRLASVVGKIDRCVN